MSYQLRQSAPPPGGSVAQIGETASTCSGGQKRPPAAAALDASTPPPSRVVVQHATLASAISLLSRTSSQEAHAAQPERLNVQSSDSSDSSDEDAPSLKKTLPDFNVRKSEDDSVVSGDDSIAWEKEEDRVMHSFANRLEAENRLEEAFEDAPVRELEEWELIAGEGEEGTADEVAPPPTRVCNKNYSTKEDECEVSQGDCLDV